MSPLFIILVDLVMAISSDKILISHTCIRGLMPNLIKKSWMVSSPDVVCISAPECRKFWWGQAYEVDTIRPPWLDKGQCIYQNLEGMKPFPSLMFLELFRSLMNCRTVQSTHPHMFRRSFRYKDRERPKNLLEHISTKRD